MAELAPSAFAHSVKLSYTHLVIRVLLDIRTLSFVTVLFCGSFGVGLLIFGSIQSRFRGITELGVGTLASSFGFLLISFRQYVPDSISIILANGLILGGLTTMYAGLRRFGGRKPFPLLYYLALIFVYLAGFLAFTYADPNVIVRIVIISGLTAPVSLLCGLVLVTDIPRELKTEHVIASVPFFAYASFSALRIIWTLGGETMSNFLEAGVVQGLAFLVWIFQILLSTFGVLWIASSTLALELRELASVGPLTQLLNRRALEEIARREVGRARRGSYDLSVVMLDIDRFKRLNDTKGHQAGDTVLASIAGILSVGLRSQDVAARYGDEEFVLVLPDTDYENAYGMTERIRQEIEQSTVTTDAGTVSITASAGVATYGGAEDDWEDLIGRADDALYRAKQDGRNLVR